MRKKRSRHSALELILTHHRGCHDFSVLHLPIPLPTALADPRRHTLRSGEDEDGSTVECRLEGWRCHGAPAVGRWRCGCGDGDEGDRGVLAVLLYNVMEMVLCRMLFASPLAARCVCKRWRDLTVTLQFLWMRREDGLEPRRMSWLFLFMVDGDIERDPCLNKASVAQCHGDQAEQGGSCSPPSASGKISTSSVAGSVAQMPARWRHKGSAGVKPSHWLVVEGDTHARASRFYSIESHGFMFILVKLTLSFCRMAKIIEARPHILAFWCPTSYVGILGTEWQK